MTTFKYNILGLPFSVEAADEAEARQKVIATHAHIVARRKAATEADIAQNKAIREKDEASRPWQERIETNLGAGFDALWQGAKQLFGQGEGDAAEQERRRLNAELAKGTTGGGVAQFVGEAAPLAVLPGGAGASLLRTAAFGAGGGAVAGALQPTLSDESKLARVALGAAGGAAAPLVVRGAQKVLPKALGGEAYLGREARAGRVLKKALGDDDAARSAMQALEAPRTSQITRDIPLTAAEASGNPVLARVELGARRELPDEFANMARRQNEAIYEAATQRAGVEGTPQFERIARNVREDVSAPLREQALESAGRWKGVSEPLGATVEQIRGESAIGTPARKLADILQANIDAGANPQQLYSLRKRLADSLSKPAGPSDDSLSVMARDANRQAMQIIQAIDARLNEAAQVRGGSATPWSDYLTRYAEHSPKVSSSRAQQQISGALGAEGRPMIGDAPETTRHVLRQAVAKYGKNRQGFDRLTPEAQSRYDELLQFLQRKEEPMRALKSGGTGGGGSQTSMQTRAGEVAVDAAAEATVPGAGFATRGVRNWLAGGTKQEVAQMMLDPQRAADGIRAALRSGQDLTLAQREFLALARGAGAGATLSLPALMSGQQ